MATSSGSSTEDKYLGRGGYGSVYLHNDKQTESWVAVKRIDVSTVVGKETKKLEAVYKEISVMKDLINHKRIVQYIRAERESNIISIYMEYLRGGSVKEELDKNGALSEDTTKKYTLQLLEGLSYLHGKRIIHRDVNGSNILCDGRGNIKLADFGISRQMSQLHTLTSKASKNTARKGTVYWMAPEVIKADKYGRRADIWSAGVTVVEMLTTQPPWSNLDQFAAMFKIGNLEKGGYVLDSSISSDVKDILDILFTSEDQRPRADELLEHSWFRDAYERFSIYYGYGDTSDDPYSHIPGVQLHYADSVESIPRDTETSYITHMHIEGKVPYSICEIASKLKHLKIREQRDELDLWGLDPPMTLTILDLSRNKFELGFPENFIQLLPNLHELQLSDCMLTELPKSLSFLKHLEVLDVSWNKLPNNSLDKLMSEQTCLRKLNLRYCGMKDVSISVKPAGLLEELDLGYNTFSNGVLPQQIGEFYSLINLNLAGCELSTLPHSMSSLQYLKVFDISSNKFSDGVLPGVISKLYNLNVLRVEGCGLSDLPESFSQLKHLRELNISSNKFKALPYITFQLLHLRELYIKDCQELKEINRDMLNLVELQMMNCSRCTALQQPPYGVCEQGLSAIRNYFKKLAVEEGVESTIVPVIVLGNTMAGKTSIIRSLQEGKRQCTFREEGSMLDEATRVFKMERLDHNGIQFNFINFGGHSVYSVAYQLGIKDSCVPIFVINMEQYNILVIARGPIEATRKLWFDYMSHLYLVFPRLDSPLLVLTHRDRIPTEEFEPLKTHLISSAEELRDEILKEEKDLLYGTSGVCKIDIFVDTSKRIVAPDHIFVFSDDITEIANIINLRNTLEKCCHKFTVVVPRHWTRVGSFLYGQTDKPYMHLSDFESEFSGREPLKIIRYLHNIGRILWFEDKKALSGYVFHRIPELTKLVGSLFSHTQDRDWADRLSNFKPFLHKGAHISKAKYEKLVNNFKEFGMMDEVVLRGIVTNFPFKIATEIFKAFQLIYGPVKHEMRDSYIIPYLCNEFMDNSWQNVGYLQLRVALTFPALLSLPHNVYQSASVSVLQMSYQPGNIIRVARNGVEICSESTVTHLIHDPNNGKFTLQLSTHKVELLSQMWVKLLENTYTVMKMVTKEWPAAQPVTHVYCSHCLFVKESNPSCYVDPKWFNYTLKELTVFKNQTFTGVEPVYCENYQPLSGSTKRVVPRPLRFPCWTLTQQEEKYVVNFLSSWKPLHGLSSKGIKDAADADADANADSDDDADHDRRHNIALALISKSDYPSDEGEEAAEETDSDLSDVEKEGYIKSDLLSRPVPLKLVPCRKRRITHLYNNTEKVYPMSDPVRGRVLIFNINSKMPAKARPGSEIDYKNISKLFVDMGFCIAKSEHELTDLTTERIFNEIKEETRKAEHSILGMFVLVMMGHGSRGDYMEDADGKLFDISRVKYYLSPKEFRTMSGKPKLMIIQACSGGVLPINIPAAPPVSSVVGSVALPQSVVSLNGADMYVMKASDESFAAIRSKSKGSWFITTLVATFYKHACHRDVESLFKIIQHRLAEHIAANPPPIGTRVGFPVDQCTFTNFRELFLFPGYSPRK